MSATETKALVERLRELAEKATPGEWHPNLASDSLNLTSVYNDAGTTIAASITARNAALVSELVNNLPTILAALEPLTRRDAMREAESAVAFVRRLASYDNASETVANWSAINDDDCDPDFEAGYDAVIEQAREVVAKLDRAALTEEPGHGD